MDNVCPNLCVQNDVDKGKQVVFPTKWVLDKFAPAFCLDSVVWLSLLRRKSRLGGNIDLSNPTFCGGDDVSLPTRFFRRKKLMSDYDLYRKFGQGGLGLMLFTLLGVGSALIALVTKGFDYQVVSTNNWVVKTYFFAGMFFSAWIVAVILAIKNNKRKLQNMEALKVSLPAYAFAFVVLAIVIIPGLKWLLMMIIAFIFLVLWVLVRQEYTRLDLFIFAENKET